jgi:hypothetical protein
MSLYYEAAAILSNPDKVGGSLKSRIFGKKDLKSSPANVFALVMETTKWSAVLKEVVEKSGLLREERKVFSRKTLAEGLSDLKIARTCRCNASRTRPRPREERNCGTGETSSSNSH